MTGFMALATLGTFIVAIHRAHTGEWDAAFGALGISALCFAGALCAYHGLGPMTDKEDK